MYHGLVLINGFIIDKMISNELILQFSRFTSSVSYLLKEMITHQKRQIKVCVITSIRNKIKVPMSKGNFIKLAYSTIIPSDNFFDICSKLQTSVQNFKHLLKILNQKTISKKIQHFMFFFVHSIMLIMYSIVGEIYHQYIQKYKKQ